MTGAADAITDPLLAAMMQNPGPIAASIASGMRPNPQHLAHALAPNAGNAAATAAIGGMTNPQLLALQLQAQNVGQQMQTANQQGSHSKNLAEMLTNLGTVALLKGQQTDTSQKLAAALMQQKQDQAKAFFPGDPVGQLMSLIDPDTAMKAVGSRYNVTDLKGGNSLGSAAGGINLTAPTQGMDAGIPYLQNGSDIQYGQMRPPGYAEQTGQQNANTSQAAQSETARENQYQDQFAPQKVAIEAQQANAASSGAATAAGQLGLAQHQSATPNAPQAPTVIPLQGALPLGWK